LGRLFGTDGVRGEANRNLTPEKAFCLGKAGAYILNKKFNKKSRERAKIVIGKDTRISGDMLEAAIAAGICSMGVDVLAVGILPTPGIAFLTRTFQALAGVVISASHNPYQDNGIKFFAGTGYKLPDELEDEIESTLEILDSLPTPSGSGIGKIIKITDASEIYGRFLQTCAVPLDGLRIVVDCANGASSEIAPRLFRELGAEVEAIFHQPDGTNINVNCGSTHPAALAGEVVKRRADIGVAFDGDADRMIAVDEKGNIIDGDAIMVICALALKEKGLLKNNSLAVTVMSNMGLHKALKDAGIHVYETKVGDRYVMEKLLATGTILGGEQSGHIIFLDYNTTGDGLISALQLLKVLKEKKTKLSCLAAQMKRFPQVLINAGVKDKEAIMKNSAVLAKVEAVQRVLGENGRVLVRPSGTESLVRIMLEGPEQNELQDLAEEIFAVIENEDKR